MMEILRSSLRSSLAWVIRNVAIRTLFNGSSARPTEIKELPSREGGRTILTHVYRAKTFAPAPVLINCHGSGFVIPWHGTDHDFACRVATETNYTVLDIAYRLSPEHPYPAAIEDLEDVVNWVLSKPDQFDLSNVSLSGFSAGGTMSLAVASSDSFPKATFRHLIAFYPPTEFESDPGTKFPPEENPRPTIPMWLARLFTSCYLTLGMDAKNPHISPLYGPAENFPPSTAIVTCGQDSLCGEAEELVSKLRSVHGESVFHRRIAGCDHAWDKTCQAGTIGGEAKDAAYGWIIAMLNQQV